MTDHDALVRAVCEFPDDDTPRLIYADFLEENGDAERAAFIRAQVQLARTPAWEPFAVMCRSRRMEWSEWSEPFRGSLPELPTASGLEWRSRAFRRGFGWSMQVRLLQTWIQHAPRLLELAPIGELYLNSASVRDEWWEFAQSDWIRHLRVVHLDGMSPVEPIRALCASPYSTGITDIHFHRASSPGMPELIEDLLKSPLGRGLKGLYFRVGYESLNHLIDALAGSDSTRLDRLTFHTMGMTPELLDRLFQSRLTSELKELDLRNDRLGEDSHRPFTNWIARLPATLETLRIGESELDRTALEALTRHGLPSLRVLDLSRNFIAEDLLPAFDLPALRSIELRGCVMNGDNLHLLTQAPFWPKLVCVDLRDNSVIDVGARHLLNAPMPPDLTAVLMYRYLPPELLESLRIHFGERLVLSD